MQFIYRTCVRGSRKGIRGINFFTGRVGGGCQGLFSGILILIRINSNFMISLLKVTCIYYPISYIFDVMDFKFRLKLLVQMIFFSQSRLYFMIKQCFFPMITIEDETQTITIISTLNI